MADKTTLPLGDAFRRGFGLAWSSPGIVALGVLTEASSVLLSVGLQLALSLLLFRELARRVALALAPLRGMSDSARAMAPSAVADWLIPLAAAAMTTALIVLTLRSLWMGAGIRRFADRLIDPASSTPVMALAGENLLRVILVGLLFLPIACAGLSIGATLIGAAAVLFFEAAGTEISHLAIAALIALALTFALFVSRGVDLLFRATLVRAVAAAQGPIAALVGGCRLLRDRFGGFVAIFLIFGLLQWMALGVTSALGSSARMLPSTAGASAILLACLVLASAIAGALVLSYLTTAEYASYTALDLAARGQLPGPTPKPGGGQAWETAAAENRDPPRDAVAEVILNTRPLAPPRDDDANEPIVGTRLAGGEPSVNDLVPSGAPGGGVPEAAPTGIEVSGGDGDEADEAIGLSSRRFEALDET